MYGIPMHRLHPFDAPHAIRAEALRRAAATLGADAGHHQLLVRGRDQLVRYHGIGGIDAPDLALDRWLDREGLAALLGDEDPDHLAPVNALAPPPADFYGTARWRALFGALGYARMLHAHVTDGIAARGEITLLRRDDDRWCPSDAAREAALVLLAGAFRRAWEQERALAPPEGVAAIRIDGTVVADEPVCAWLATHDAAGWLRRRTRHALRRGATELGRSDRAWVPGGFAQWRPIPGGGTLVALEPVTAMDLPPVLARLTAVQRRVASLAAAGATAAEIARELERSPETVREHLTRIYQRLGVGSRSELASACRRVMV